MDPRRNPLMKTALIRISRYGLKLFLAALAITALLYIMVFTPLGNRLVKPLFQTVLSAYVNAPLEVQTFSLNPNSLHLNIRDEHNNLLHLQGKFSLITQNVHAMYTADFSHNGGLNTLNLPFKTSGVINGNSDIMNLQGVSEIWEGGISYRIRMYDFKPSDVQISLIDIHYQNLMQWLELPHESTTLLTGEINLKGLAHRDVSGVVALQTQTRHFSPSPIIDDNTSFDFLSLFTDDKGKIQPFRLNLTLKASANELGIFEQFAMLPLRGNADLRAILQGDHHRLVLEAKSNIARSASHARIHWKRLRPSYIYLDMKHADAATLFHLFSRSAPIEGKLSVYAESNMTHTAGKISLLNGLTHPDILKRDYRITQPKSHFTTSILLNATPKTIHYNGTFSSDIGRTTIDDTTTHKGMLRDLLKALP